MKLLEVRGKSSRGRRNRRAVKRTVSSNPLERGQPSLPPIPNIEERVKIINLRVAGLTDLHVRFVGFLDWGKKYSMESAHVEMGDPKLLQTKTHCSSAANPRL